LLRNNKKYLRCTTDIHSPLQAKPVYETVVFCGYFLFSTKERTAKALFSPPNIWQYVLPKNENKLKPQLYKEIEVLLCEVNNVAVLTEKLQKLPQKKTPSCAVGFTGETGDITESGLNYTSGSSSCITGTVQSPALFSFPRFFSVAVLWTFP